MTGETLPVCNFLGARRLQPSAGDVFRGGSKVIQDFIYSRDNLWGPEIPCNCTERMLNIKQ